jgi:glycosyltransferase involved in cell wall biosynthesis
MKPDSLIFGDPKRNSPLVSIIIPVRDGEKFISQAIESCLNQTYKNIELLVINDGSTDATSEIIKKFGLDSSLKLSGLGANAARNFGIRRARGVFVKFLDADDILLAQAIERQVEFAARLSPTEIGFGRMLQFGSLATNSEDGFYAPNLNDSTLDDLIINNLQTSLPLHRVDALNAVGGFDESLRIGQEWNLHARMAHCGLRFKPDDTPVLLYRAHREPTRITVRYTASAESLDEKLKSIKKTYGLRGAHRSSRTEEHYIREVFGVFETARHYNFSRICYQLAGELASNKYNFKTEFLGRRLQVVYKLVGHRMFFNVMAFISQVRNMQSPVSRLGTSFRDFFPARKI